MKLTYAGEELELLLEKAVFWPRTSTLIIADPHFGKAAAFRAAGIPVPTGTTATDLARLTAALERTRAQRLLVLGDFFHAKSGRVDASMSLLQSWRAAHADLAIELVIGNHDRHAGKPPADWRIACHVHPVVEPPFLFCHETCESGEHIVVAGHVHPTITLQERSGARLRAPCFRFGERDTLLPAFGSFTGGAAVRRRAGDRIIVVGPDELLEL